jgi:hypothetical protein
MRLEAEMAPSKAKDSVLRYLNGKYAASVGDELVVIDAATRSAPYGWVFFYSTRRYLETRDMVHALGGNGPVVFECDTGAIVELATRSPVIDLIRDYEATRSAGRVTK